MFEPDLVRNPEDRLGLEPAYSKVRYRGSTFRPSVRSFVRQSVRPSTIYVKVAVIAGSMKPCIVITLDTHFK